ncbi:rab15 effector protein [Ambystoma mexicanum]|uniref:rab15 effector protein n=1 Tax=Ambystoma mexicanum TaxID=8296 RepID=UPI0037E8EFC6
MGQNTSQEIIVVEDNKADFICDVFSQGVVHASQKLKTYLAFEDPESKVRPGLDTLKEIFLVNFIGFCVEKGVEERIRTSKMSKQQSLLLGVDWIWTLLGPNKQVKVQIAVQAFQVCDLKDGCSSSPSDLLASNKEVLLADELYRSKGTFEKLEEFCALVGGDCWGFFIVFGLPGKPKDTRGVLLDSVNQEKRRSRLCGESALQQFILNTNNYLPTREMLEKCLTKSKEFRNRPGKVYINFL